MCVCVCVCVFLEGVCVKIFDSKVEIGRIDQDIHDRAEVLVLLIWYLDHLVWEMGGIFDMWFLLRVGHLHVKWVKNCIICNKSHILCSFHVMLSRNDLTARMKG